MADKKEAKNKAEEEHAPEDSGKKGKLKTIMIVAGLMLGEGVGLFVVMNLVATPPDAALAADDEAAMDDPLNLETEAELELCSVDAFNRREGRLFVYHMQLSVMVDAENKEIVEKFVRARTASIRDRVQLVIRSAEPVELNDPTLDALKRQIRNEVNNLLGGKELIKQVLIAKMLQSRTNL